MARKKQGQRPESAPRYGAQKPTPTPPVGKAKRGGVGGPPARLNSGPLLRRTDFDTSQFVPLFRTTLNPHQEAAWELMGKRRITMLLGPAGTAKTHCAIARALHELIVARSVGKVVLVRPAVEAGEKLGFLPGDVQQKLDPFFRPVYDILDDLVGWQGKLREQVNQQIEIAPVAFMRGRTFKDAFVILDEGQNCTWTQLKMVMTRVGKGSRMVVTGDADQSDLPHKGRNPLARVADNIRRKGLLDRGILGCHTFPEKAIVRDEAVVEVLNAFDDGLGEDDWPTEERGTKKTRRAA